MNLLFLFPVTIGLGSLIYFPVTYASLSKNINNARGNIFKDKKTFNPRTVSKCPNHSTITPPHFCRYAD